MMRRTWARNIGVVLTVALIATLGLFLGKLADAKRCEPVNAELITDARVNELISQGWAGKTDDGSEALYRPGC